MQSVNVNVEHCNTSEESVIELNGNLAVQDKETEELCELNALRAHMQLGNVR